MKVFRIGFPWPVWPMVFLFLGCVLLMSVPRLGQAQEALDHGTWGVGWDHGLTVRTWLAERWELSVAAGPNDYLVKEETRSWLLTDPESHQGLLEVPNDVRQENGWVRLQVGRLLKKHGRFRATVYAGAVYEWIVHQERDLLLHDLNNDYDSFELDRHTKRWIWTLGIRPSWQPTSFLTVETAFGLNYIVDNWDQTSLWKWSGVEGSDYQELDGHGERFQNFGFDGAASIQIIIWL